MVLPQSVVGLCLTLSILILGRSRWTDPGFRWSSRGCRETSRKIPQGIVSRSLRPVSRSLSQLEGATDLSRSLRREKRSWWVPEGDEDTELIQFFLLQETGGVKMRQSSKVPGLRLLVKCRASGKAGPLPQPPSLPVRGSGKSDHSPQSPSETEVAAVPPRKPRHQKI